MTRLILASSSPRRSRLLSEAGFDFDVAVPDVDESIHDSEEAHAYALRLAREKAAACVAPRQLTLGADTVVVLSGQTLGKPADAAHAIDMLTKLSGSTHDVMTGWALANPDGFVGSDVATTRVVFRELSAAEVRTYVETGEPLDRAGAYAIQGGAGGFVSDIEGSFANVMGLPIETIVVALAQAGIN
ncbi:MAG: septum formation inhibitor Maf, partial [Acidimicrobiia bacterium]|nr:septum formation inhibitor Maf [Acidimicrobiia bacterium]